MKKEHVAIAVLFLLFSTATLMSQTLAVPPSNYGEIDAGSETNPFLISNLANLRWFTETPDYWGNAEIQYYFSQTADIDAYESREWNQGRGMQMISPFSGHYNGNHYTIIGRGHTSTLIGLGFGFFGDIYDSTIQNILLSDVATRQPGGYPEDPRGFLVNRATNSIIRGCGIDGKFNTFSYLPMVLVAGVLVGSALNTQIEACYTDIVVFILSEPVMIYNLVGRLENSTLSNCYVWISLTGILEPYPPYDVERYVFGSELIGQIINSRVENLLIYSRELLVEDDGNPPDYIIDESDRPMWYDDYRNHFWDVEATGLEEWMRFQVYISNYTPVIPFTIKPPADSLNIKGYTTAEMKRASTYINDGWDFVNVWAVNPEVNEGYPFINYNGNIENILPPVNLSAYIDGLNVTIEWDILNGYRYPIGFNVYRDGILLNEDNILQNRFYVDTVEDYGDYIYKVSAVYESGLCGESVGLEVQIIVPTFTPISELTAEIITPDPAQEARHVYLTWVAPVNMNYGVVRGYGLYRDEVWKSEISIAEYMDDDAELDTEYTYSVIVLYEDPDGESAEVEINIIVPKFTVPINLQAEAGDAVVSLSWEAPESQNYGMVIGYNVYRDGTEMSIGMIDEASYVDNDVINGIEYIYYVTAVYEDPDGESLPSNSVSITPEIVSEDEESIIAYKTELRGNYPNPFNPSTTISFSISSPSSVRGDKGGVNLRIDIYNIKGQKIKTLVDEIRKPGMHTVVWNGLDDNDKNVGSGIYFYKMSTEDFTSVKRMILLK